MGFKNECIYKPSNELNYKYMWQLSYDKLNSFLKLIAHLHIISKLIIQLSYSEFDYFQYYYR